MSDLYTLILFPIIVAVLSLIIEYWIIQPIRENSKLKNSLGDEKSHSNENPQQYIYRIMSAFPHVNLYRVGASFLSRVGSFIANFPRAVVASTASVLSIIITMPLFLNLYNAEKYGICIYKPTCKEYLIKSIEKYGPIRGILLGMMRVGRCNSYAKGGKDPVPEPEKLKTVVLSYKKKGPKYRRQYNSILLSLIFLPFMCALYLVLVGYVAYKLIEIQNHIVLLFISFFIALFSWSLYIWISAIVYKTFGRLSPVILQLYNLALGLLLVHLLWSTIH